MRVRIELDYRASVSGFFQHCFDIDRIRLARQQQSSGWMSEYRETRIVHRLEHAFGHRNTVHAEPRMHRADDVVEAVEHFILVIDVTVGKDVSLNSFQYPEVGHFGVQLVNLFLLSDQRVTLQSPSVERRLRMIRNPE